jgi:hypothetical protein
MRRRYFSPRRIIGEFRVAGAIGALSVLITAIWVSIGPLFYLSLGFFTCWLLALPETGRHDYGEGE